MQYQLDPKLLPPAGASVQCTSCRLVFTALPSGEAVVSGEAPGRSARGEVSRTSSSSTTRIFGNPYLQQQQAEQAAAQDATATLTYGLRGQRPEEDAPDRTPARGSPVTGSAPAPVGKTQVFGAVAAARPPPPAASTTQVFGAVSLPAQAPAPTSTQVFGAIQVPASAPAPATTQVFGAAQVPASAPAAASPPPGSTPARGAAVLPATKPPSPVTTQVFGADSVPGLKPKSAATTTQVFGADSVPGLKPKSAATTTQVFGAAAVRDAQKAREESSAWGVTGEQRSAGASSGPVSLPPEAPVPTPTPVPLPPQASMPASAPIAAPVTLPPEPLPERSGTGSSRRQPAFEQAPDVFDRIERQAPVREPASSGGMERLLVVVAAVVVLGLTIWLTYPLWRTRDAGMPAETLRAKDEAIALLRRDDEASREQAFARLRPLVAQFPRFTEAQAELAVALALKLDDTKVELELLAQQESRLRKEIEQLSAAQAPADWENRVNAAKAELEPLGAQRRRLEGSVSDLTKQVEASQQIIRAAPETEPAADVVARLKAQAILAGVLGSEQALPLAERLHKVENPAHWSPLCLAEYVLNASSASPISMDEQGQALQAVREQDTTFIRAYVLGARIALRRNDLGTAHSLLDTVDALNPNHALAQKLRTWATYGNSP